MTDIRQTKKINQPHHKNTKNPNLLRLYISDFARFTYPIFKEKNLLHFYNNFDIWSQTHMALLHVSIFTMLLAFLKTNCTLYNTHNIFYMSPRFLQHISGFFTTHTMFYIFQLFFHNRFLNSFYTSLNPFTTSTASIFTNTCLHFLYICIPVLA